MIARLHRIVGSLILIFIIGHLAVHLTALQGIDAHIEALELARRFYRNVVMEPVLLAMFLIQIGLGLRLAIGRWRDAAGDRLARLQMVSGLYLAGFAMIHVSAALSARATYALDTNFYWAAATLLNPVTKWLFYPYYALAIIAVFAHVAIAIYYRSGNTRAAGTAVASGFVVASLILAAFGGWLFPVALPAANQRYLDSMLSYFQTGSSNVPSIGQ